ncbi:DNA polymerase [Xenorhabdus bovienii]|uniref:DNA polymerase n=1 Tax=Xenorhabdus bovienii TaxID=40576 RepID=UPI003DA6088C
METNLELLFCDLETYSDIPINCGTHRYAENAEVMLFAYALGNNPVNVWDVTCDANIPAELQKALTNPNILTVWHNGGNFDSVILQHTLGIDIPLERLHDTMVQALAHGLPGALGALCEVLGVSADKAKDKEGKALIHLFCKPRPKTSKIRRATRETHPEEWRRFILYAGSDIEAMREVYRKAPKWNMNPTEVSLWQLDQCINRRGICMDIDLANSALSAVEQEQKRLAERTQEMTDGEVQAATQRDAMLRHIAAAFGVELPDMQKSTLERRIADPDLPVALRELLSIRLQSSTTSTSKYKALMKSVSSDGRLRGTKQFCGASRTGRWAGRIFQPDNLPRPTLPQNVIDTGIEALKAGCADLLYDDIMQLTSSAVRGVIIAPAGKKLVVSDLSNIEGRMLAWLAGELWKLQAFRDNDAGIGADLYKLAYARAFNIEPDEVTKDQRQIGKVMELGLGYGGGVAAFVTFALTYALDLDELATAALPSIPVSVQREAMSWYKKSVEQNQTYGLSEKVFITCDSLKRMWRNAHTATVPFWYELEEAVKRAISSPNITIPCRKLRVRRDGAWLRVVLPSGRAVCYPSPRLDDGQISYMGTNPYSRKWQRLKTYGGKLVENVTQAAARDVLAGNMPLIEEAGYAIVLTVHDEIISEAPDTLNYSHEHLSTLLAINPSWALDLPLNAGGFESYRYKKE